MINLFKVIHVFSLFFLVAFTGVAAAAARSAELRQYRRPILMWGGIATFGVFMTGFGLLGMEHFGMPFWAVIKIACWLFVSAAGGIMFRRPEKLNAFSLATGGAVLLALLMVFFKPIL